MRLAMIEKPENVILETGYKIIQKKFGKVLTPLKTIYARKPALMSIAQKVDKTSSKLSFESSVYST